jgi:hypothetical protein
MHSFLRKPVKIQDTSGESHELKTVLPFKIQLIFSVSLRKTADSIRLLYNVQYLNLSPGF